MPQPNDSGLRQSRLGNVTRTRTGAGAMTHACRAAGATPRQAHGARTAGATRAWLDDPGFPQSPVDLPLRLDDAGASPTTPQGPQHK